jgi:hypothetical protein
MDDFPRSSPTPTSWWRQPRFWIGVCLAVGLALRAYHYLREPSMWHDEAYQMHVLQRGYDTAFGGQDFAEAAPPLLPRRPRPRCSATACSPCGCCRFWRAASRWCCWQL